MSNWKLPKWAVVVAAAFLFLPLVADWVAPGDGARIAAGWLERGRGGFIETALPLWGWLVGLMGKDVAVLGAISAGAGLLCVWLVTAIVGAIFGAAVRGAKAGGAKGEEGNYAGVVCPCASSHPLCRRRAPCAGANEGTRRARLRRGAAVPGEGEQVGPRPGE